MLAPASRIYNESVKENTYAFIAKSPKNSLRILLPAAPQQIIITNATGEKIAAKKSGWDSASGTYYLAFDNNPDGVKVELSW